MRRIVSRLIREAGYEDHGLMKAENGREARAAGADFLLSKPFTTADMARVLGIVIPA